MTVSLIDYTGAGSADPLYAARLLVYTKQTRLRQGSSLRGEIAQWTEEMLLGELDYMSKTIPSSWEFVNYTFEVIDVPIAITRQMIRTRTASFAEQSTRVTDMKDFKAARPDSVCAMQLAGRWDHIIRLIGMAYDELVSKGVPKEDARGLLPLNTYSSLIVQYNLRTFSDLMGKRQSLRAQGPYREIVSAMREEIYRVHPWAKLFIEPDRTQTPFLDNLIAEVLDGRPLTEIPALAGAVKELEKLKGTH